ncbi:MAG: energy transducer TonB [Halobacteriovoraceae bacterium]|nr:energy transducer TonB [Halobacteriovoraceae bacterium]
MELSKFPFKLLASFTCIIILHGFIFIRMKQSPITLDKKIYKKGVSVILLNSNPQHSEKSLRPQKQSFNSAQSSSPISGITQNASPLNQIIPQYPNLSVRREEEGIVTVLVTITSQGKVEKVQVTQSSGFENLDRAAIEAVTRATFKPASQNNIPVASLTELSFQFKIEDR